jgi:DNA-binding transcriptional regulator YiaG
MPDTLTPTTLRAWREARGMSRAEAAVAFCVPLRTLEKLEQNRSETSALWGPLSRIIELIEALED